MGEGGGLTIPLIGLTPVHFYACPETGPGNPMPYVWLFLCFQWFDVRGSLIMLKVLHCCSNFIFITTINLELI